MSTGDVVSREAAWLSSNEGVGVPVLTKVFGGPFDIVQAYWPRTPSFRQIGLYVLRSSVSDKRWANQRKKPSYQIRLKVIWPVGSTSVSVDIAEIEQANLDAAVDAIIGRVRGLVGDHTHGGRFLAAAEAPAPSEINVSFVDPEQTISNGGFLSAEITYVIDDFEDVI